MAPADRPTHDDLVTLADSLARSYGPSALARALVVRLRRDHRPELAEAVVALFRAVAAEARERPADAVFPDPNAHTEAAHPIVTPGPVNPGDAERTDEAGEPIIITGPPDPHQT